MTGGSAFLGQVMKHIRSASTAEAVSRRTTSLWKRAFTSHSDPVLSPRPMVLSGSMSTPISSSHWLPTRLICSSSALSVNHGVNSAASNHQSIKLSIGERARQLQTQRMWTLVLGGAGVAVFSMFLVNAFQESLMFYVTPTQALEALDANPSKTRFRLGGLVLDGSVRMSPKSTEMEFVVTDLVTEMPVRFRGALPDLFREGHSVVAEGFMRPLPVGDGQVGGSDGSGVNIAGQGNRTAGGVVQCESGGAGEAAAAVSEGGKGHGFYFEATEVLAKHDEKYMPKEVAAAIEKNKAAAEIAAAEAGQDALGTPGTATLSAKPGSPSLPSAASPQPTSSASSAMSASDVAFPKKQRLSKLSKVAQSPEKATEYRVDL